MSITQRARQISRRLFISRTYRNVFDTEEGKIVLSHLLKIGFVNSTTHVPGNSTESAHREGMRRLVLSIFKNAKIDQEHLEQMLEESYEQNEDI